MKFRLNNSNHKSYSHLLKSFSITAHFYNIFNAVEVAIGFQPLFI